MNELRKAIRLFETQAGLASEVGCAQGAISNSLTRGRVSVELCPRIERATKGVCTCERLNPDVKWVRVADPKWPWHRDGRPLLDLSGGA